MAYGRKGPSCNSTRYETTVLEVTRKCKTSQILLNIYIQMIADSEVDIQFAIQTDHIALASFDICTILDEMI